MYCVCVCVLIRFYIHKYLNVPTFDSIFDAYIPFEILRLMYAKPSLHRSNQNGIINKYRFLDGLAQLIIIITITIVRFHLNNSSLFFFIFAFSSSRIDSNGCRRLLRLFYTHSLAPFITFTSLSRSSRCVFVCCCCCCCFFSFSHSHFDCEQPATTSLSDSTGLCRRVRRRFVVHHYNVGIVFEFLILDHRTYW